MASNRLLFVFILAAQICGLNFGVHAAEQEVEITFGLTCSRIGRERSKWDDLEGKSGYLDAPWYTGQKGHQDWSIEDSAKKKSRIWSDRYFQKTQATWTRFAYFADRQTNLSRAMIRHHRWNTASSSQYTWTDSNRFQYWARYIADCDNIEGGMPISSVPQNSILQLAKGFYIEVDNNAANNFRLAINYLPRAYSATGGRSIQEYQNNLARTILDFIPPSTSAYTKFERAQNGLYLDKDVNSVAFRVWPRVWIQGFGGTNTSFSYEITPHGSFGNWESTYGGYLIGTSFEVTKELSISPFFNFGSINVDFLDVGGGSWDASGYGGGVTAALLKSNFYLKGLLGLSSFNGIHSRGLVPVGEFEGGVAYGDKRTTSFVSSLKAGIPLQAWWIHYEPQLSITWNKNQDHEWDEVGGDIFNLSYKNYNDNFLRSNIGLKVSTPISLSESSVLTPFFRAGLLSDWDLNNPSLRVANKLNGNVVEIPINQKYENGIILEAGINYRLIGSSGLDIELYAEGGIENWDASMKATNWLVSGGLVIVF